MTNATSKKLRIGPTGMRLHEWIAFEGGYWQDEGLDVEIDWGLVSQFLSYGNLEYKERPQDLPFVNGEPIVCNACAWGSIANAGAGMGKFSDQAYGIARNAIFVRPDSWITRPEDLANVPIGVGLRAGSHFSVPQSLEPYIPVDQIKIVNVGGFGTRLSVLLSGEVEATSLLDPQISMAEELGLRKIIEGAFNTLWWVDASTNQEVLQAYFRVLARAERDLEGEPSRYLELWHYSVPPEFKDRKWDYSRFHEGEHVRYETFPKERYREVLEQMERWRLDDLMQDKSYENLVFQTA
jgi:NitT/TauT family transport system substrate-binding protein